MFDWNLEGSSDRERACLAHLEESKKLGVSFSRYCRENKTEDPRVELGQAGIDPQGRDWRGAPG